MDCNISIVFRRQIREKLERIIDVRDRNRQNLIGEATEMEMVEEGEAAHDEGEKGRENRPNEKQGDVNDVDHSDWVIMRFRWGTSNFDASRSSSKPLSNNSCISQ